jgi:hypothetical protein
VSHGCGKRLGYSHRCKLIDTNCPTLTTFFSRSITVQHYAGPARQQNTIFLLTSRRIQVQVRPSHSLRFPSCQRFVSGKESRRPALAHVSGWESCVSFLLKNNTLSWLGDWEYERRQGVTFKIFDSPGTVRIMHFPPPVFFLSSTGSDYSTTNITSMSTSQYMDYSSQLIDGVYESQYQGPFGTSPNVIRNRNTARSDDYDMKSARRLLRQYNSQLQQMERELSRLQFRTELLTLRKFSVGTYNLSPAHPANAMLVTPLLPTGVASILVQPPLERFPCSNSANRLR